MPFPLVKEVHELTARKQPFNSFIAGFSVTVAQFVLTGMEVTSNGFYAQHQY